MSDCLYKVIFLIALLLPSLAWAQEDEVKAAVAISVQQDQEIWAGQQVTLNLDLKTSGFSFSNTHFNLPEVSGAFLMQTDTTTIKLSEKIDAMDWQIIRYPLALYPQSSGQLSIPSINVRFTTSAGFGSTEKAFEFQTEPLELVIKLPPGVTQGDLVITTRSFELDHDWQPASTTARAGDAFTLTVTRRASDISAMLLPPLPVYRTRGLATYPQAPEINDKTNRGDLIGERIDTIIWVVETPGTYEIPGIRFQWWDPGNHELKQQVIPGLSLDVVPSLTGNATTQSTENQEQGSHYRLQVLPLVLIVLSIGILAWYFRKARGQQLTEEKLAWNTLQKACKSNSAGQAYSAIYTWLIDLLPTSTEKPRPGTLSEFGRIITDAQFSAELNSLQEALISSNNQWQGAELLKSLQRVRSSINRQQIVQSKVELAPLNP